MPDDFIKNQPEYEGVSAQSQEVVEYFSAHNITLYKDTWSFNITANADAEILEDTPTVDHQLEFHFMTGNNGINFVQIRHAEPFFYLWLQAHFIEPVEPYRTQMGYTGYDDGKVGFPVVYYMPVITRANILAIADDGNSSVFEAACSHVRMSFALLNQNSTVYTSLEESFDDDELTVYVSYEIDWDAMKPSAFTLVAQLIFWQNPDLGLPSPLDEIVGYGMSLAFSLVIAVVIYTIVTRLIPTIQGGIED